MAEKPTHTLVKSPRMSVRSLADYMAASEIAKRTVVRDSKYRAIARVIQHDQAKLEVTNYISHGSADPNVLIVKADYIRGKLPVDDFDATLNEHNADYLARFAKVVGNLHLPDAEILPGKSFPPLNVHGVRVTLNPALLLRRLTKTNKVRSGAVMYRYAKGKALPAQTGCYQAAAMMGFLAEVEKDSDSQPERLLCLTIDTWSGLAHPAPTNAVSVFNNMKAACATIAERWENIEPPKGAILA